MKAVLFDLDSTLWRVSPELDLVSVRRKQTIQWLALLTDWGLTADMVQINEFLADPWARRAQMLWSTPSAGEPGLSLKEPDTVGMLREALQALGIEVDAAQAAGLWDASHVPHPGFPMLLYDDTREALTCLQSAGLSVGVVTNRPWSARVFTQDLDALGIGDLLHQVISSADVGFRKPHVAVFQAALHALGASPQDTLMVGDSLVSDVAGAKAASLTAVWLNREAERRQPGDPEPDFEISTLLDLPRLVRDCIVRENHA